MDVVRERAAIAEHGEYARIISARLLDSLDLRSKCDDVGESTSCPLARDSRRLAD